MLRLSRMLLATAALAALTACGGPPQNSAGPPAAGKPGVDPASVNTPYSAIAAGKVDIEGGLVDVAARAPGIVKEVLEPGGSPDPDP